MSPPTAPPPSSPSACSRATSARSRGRSRSWRTTIPRAGRSCARSTRRPATRRVVGFTGPPGVGKSTLIGRLVEHARAARARGGGALDRPQLAVHPRRPARRPHPAVRPLPRPGRVHPLDGQPRLARRAVRGHAPGRAADGRLRQGRRVPRDRGRGPGRGGHHRPRRHRRARADARQRRLDPGAQGGRDGDPRRDRGQQVRPPAHRHDGARDPRRALARPAGGLAGADPEDRGVAAARASRSWRRRSPSTASSSPSRARSTSAAGAT